jgi:hypothetical protein
MTVTHLHQRLSHLEHHRVQASRSLRPRWVPRQQMDRTRRIRLQERQSPCPEETPSGDFGSAEAEPAQVDITVSCPGPEFSNLQSIFSDDFMFRIRIFRPDLSGDWPPDPAPLIVFSHGNGQLTNGYATLFPELNRLGFIVASVDEIENTVTETRAQHILCASRFFANDWSDIERLNSTVVFMGHSTGGEGAILAANLRTTLANPEDSHNLVAVLAIAPANNLNIGLQPSIPLYTIQGAVDEDPSHSVITIFDRSFDELLTADLSGRYMTWVYGVSHQGSGGFDGTCNPDLPFNCLLDTRGNVAVREFFSRFLRWRVFGQTEFRINFAGPDADAIPEALDDPALWEEFDGIAQVYRGYLEDSNLESGQRLILDAMEDGDVTVSTANGAISQQGTFDILEEGPATSLVPNVDHRTGAIHAQWSGNNSSLAWAVPGEFSGALDGASMLSFRVANVARVIDPATCTVDSSPLSFSVFMRDLDADEHSITLPDLTLVNDLPEQDRRDQGAQCLMSNFMRHVRIPLSEFCQDGVDLTSLDQVGFRFDGSTDGEVLIDSLEFTRSPFDDPGGCGPPLICM